MRFTDTGHPPFVGRHQELERLEKAWEAVERGERQAVFIGGEPGSGKTRIAAELARGLHSRSAVVLLGSNSPDLSYAYEPLVEALNHLLQSTAPGSLAELLPDSSAELLRLSPHLHRHRSDLREPSNAQEHRRELFSAYVELIRSVASERPVALILEDMHWSSAPSRLLMANLIENTHDTRLLVVATMRNTAPDRSGELSHTIADLYRLPGVTRIDLAGLGTGDVEEYLMISIGHPDPHIQEAAAILHDQSGGNPFFLRELWRDLEGSGGAGVVRSSSLSAPPSVRDTLERRIRSFDEESRSILEHAAVLGAVFDPADVVEAVDAPERVSLGALDRATETGLIAPTTGGLLVFQHALIRQALLDGLSPSRSAHAHARLAEAISARYRPGSRLAPLLARLYDGARPLGYTELAVFYMTEAAAAAQRMLAHEEAAALFEQAADSIATDPPTRERLLLSAARSQLLAGEFPEAQRIYRMVNSFDDPRTAVKAAIGFEDASWRPGMLGHEARALLEAAVDRIPADPSDPLYVSALTALARAHTFSGAIEASGELGRRALAMARQIGDDTLIADALVASLLRMMTGPGEHAEADEMSEELRAIAMRTGNYDGLGPAGAMKASMGYLRGDSQAYEEGWHDVHLAATKTGQPFWEWVDGCFQHCAEFMAGRFDRAAQTAERINELGYSFGTEGEEGPYGMQMYMVQRERGALEAIRGMVTGDPAQDGTWTPGLLSLYVDLEMEDPARDLLSRSIELPRAISERTAAYPAVIAFLTEAALYVGDRSAIEKLLSHMELFDGQNLMVGLSVAVLGSGNTFLGRMHAALGDLDLAESHFRRALEMDMAIGSIVHQSVTMAHFADMVDRKGDSDRAADYRASARRLAEPIGQQRVLDLVDRPAGDLPDGLTTRELDVLRLVVEGASNKEIGDRLFISRNTVANHVRSILVKTGSPNRTAAATYASEHRLV